jgi:hypothetical protein
MKRSTIPLRLCSTLAILCLGLVSADAASIPAVTVSGGDTRVGHNENGSHTMGWALSTNDDVLVTMLGWYDHEQNGLIEPHKVGIFDTTGALLVSTEVPAGTAGALDAQFRYVPITPFLLLAGVDYVIGGTYGELGTDVHMFEVTDRVTIPQISIPPAAARYSASGGYSELSYPSLNFMGYNSYMGPNFQVEAVPEPAGVLLFGSAGAAALILRRISSPRQNNLN